jgi:hypothetical protein
MSMRDGMEAAEQRALEARCQRRDVLARMVGTRVTHAYTGGREGTVTKAGITSKRRERITVAWDGGKTTTHDVGLIRPVAS